jgi:ABC-type transporter Mla MlaB component
MRITVHDEPAAITFQLEGSLAGAAVRLLEESWQQTIASLPKPTVCVDLTGVTFIDDAGQACLTAMHRDGAEFVAPDALTKHLVAEITGPRASDDLQSGDARKHPRFPEATSR